MCVFFDNEHITCSHGNTQFVLIFNYGFDSYLFSASGAASEKKEQEGNDEISR